jgi:hypothetical protein
MMTTTHVHASQLGRLVKGSHEAHENLQEAVLQYLALHSVPAVPIITGPRVTPRARGGFELRANAEQRGMGDVIACLPGSGRLALIECKTGHARRSPAQVRMHRRFATSGALCLVVRNVLELAPHIAANRPKPAGGSQ